MSISATKPHQINTSTSSSSTSSSSSSLDSPKHSNWSPIQWHDKYKHEKVEQQHTYIAMRGISAVLSTMIAIDPMDQESLSKLFDLPISDAHKLPQHKFRCYWDSAIDSIAPSSEKGKIFDLNFTEDIFSTKQKKAFRKSARNLAIEDKMALHHQHLLHLQHNLMVQRQRCQSIGSLSSSSTNSHNLYYQHQHHHSIAVSNPSQSQYFWSAQPGFNGGNFNRC